MSNIFDQWDQQFDTKGLQEDIKNAAKSSGDFEDVPHGLYEVSVQKMELKATKKDNSPMVSIWFNIVNGDHKGQKIFMNQVITKGFQIHIVNQLLRDLTGGVDCPDIEFKTYSQYAELLMDIHEIIADSFEYGLNYAENKKGFDTFEITDIFPLD